MPTEFRLRTARATDLPDLLALEARFPTRGMAEAESEMSRLSSGTGRLVVCFARRGDMERTQGLVSSSTGQRPASLACHRASASSLRLACATSTIPLLS